MLSKTHQKLLLTLARKTLESYFQKKDYNLENLPEEFKEKRGVFVTLHQQGELRGCIGYILPFKLLYQGIKENALNAAFHDPRFPSLKKEELPAIQIEISVLTPPKKLEFKDEKDLLDKLKPNVDGVILQKSGRQSTFLPQVWEQLPDKTEFLEHLSLKAGLSKDAWKTAEILTYQAEVFSEE